MILSLLAVGDTGEQHALPALREGQRSVARGLAAEDLRQPVDALILLGDNFYPDGLRGAELAQRVRSNLVRPYCRFVELAGPRSREVADGCRLRDRRRHPIPIFAVLGNHDYDLLESPALQRHAVAQFVSNWRMPRGTVEVHELGRGVSLILLDSQQLVREGEEEVVREAIRRSRGPWRILAAHRPQAPLREQLERGEPSLAERLAVPGVPVHLALAGDHHNLQVIEGTPPGAALQIVAGSGATIHSLQHDYPNRRFALEQTGFARVDLVGRGAEARLVASLYAMPRYPARFWTEPEPVARWSVGRDGSVRPE